ncbi:hypothetical protein ACRYKS_21695 [Escherichia coli]|uniref:Transcriptional regulator HdfR n=1 Tax=Escherichia phage fEgEco12 TaxID=3158837 RepID=A0AAU7PGX6_9CAUD|nr:hypothetical protein [Escherichia coli]QAY00496.1 hypothetical protein Ecwhy1_217 [Escherichia phage Ecwhy_1]QXN76282.1 hypothetical protein [Escherichia phage BF17]WGM49536.1 hypothetical protein EcMJ_294 [Escherichia phage vB_Ec-M-J]EGE5776292.1 hypothetical protein [Escherichia coli]ELW0836218.1 hypothetical protein [Escherichia coli]
MIPEPHNSTEFQNDVLLKVREVHGSDAELTDRMLLMSIFENFRTGGGLRLSKFGYTICKENILYEFTKIPLQREFKSSIIFTSLDRICTSPYYVEGQYIYLSDAMIVTELTLCGDDFRMLFSMHM